MMMVSMRRSNSPLVRWRDQCFRISSALLSLIREWGCLQRSSWQSLFVRRCRVNLFISLGLYSWQTLLLLEGCSCVFFCSVSIACGKEMPMRPCIGKLLIALSATFLAGLHRVLFLFLFSQEDWRGHDHRWWWCELSGLAIDYNHLFVRWYNEPSWELSRFKHCIITFLIRSLVRSRAFRWVLWLLEEAWASVLLGALLEGLLFVTVE